MDLLILLLSYLSPLNSDSCLYKSLSELMLAKLSMPYFSINNAQNRGMLNFSNSYHYESIKELGNLFIKGKIKLSNFLFDYKKSMSISDATLLKRSGKKVYGTKKLKNHITKSYEVLQDLLIYVERFNGLYFITDFKIINHNKKHLTKPEEIAIEIKSGKIKKNSWLIIDGGLKSIELLKEARIHSIKLVTRLNKNFVVSLFGRKFRENDILSKVNPIKRYIKLFQKSYSNVRVLLTPAHASWLNQAELLLRAFTCRYLDRGDWKSRQDLINHLDVSWREYNHMFAHPISWSWTRYDLRRWMNRIVS